MALTKEKKKEIIKKIKENLEKEKIILFVDIAGLKAKDIFELRRELKKNSALLMVAKKTLINLALKENNIPFEKEKYQGELGLVFGFGDEVEPAKIVDKAVKVNEHLKILGGLLNREIITKEKVVEIAKLCSKEETRAKLIGCLNSPMFNLLNILNGNIKSLIYILKQRAEQIK